MAVMPWCASCLGLCVLTRYVLTRLLPSPRPLLPYALHVRACMCPCPTPSPRPLLPLARTGFGSLMVTTLISYLSHSQVWAVQQGRYVFVGGRSNRAKMAFEIELNQVGASCVRGLLEHPGAVYVDGCSLAKLALVSGRRSIARRHACFRRALV